MRARDLIEAEVQGELDLPKDASHAPGTAKNFLKKLGRVEVHDPFTWDDFNPDAELSPDDLMPWVDFIGQGTRPIRVANKWFPGERGRIKAVKLIRGYLWNKMTAMRLRLAGNIAQAIQYEDICQRVYNQLPDYARW